MMFRKIEEIQAWQEARRLTNMIYERTRKKPLAADFALTDQIRRAGVSVMANIAEGFGRRSSSEFARSVTVGRGSLHELRSHLFVALDQGYLDQPAFEGLDGQLERVLSLVNGLLTYLLGRRKG